jgi:hypothetical protein
MSQTLTATAKNELTKSKKIVKPLINSEDL